MFERYTERLRRVLFFARYGAVQSGSREVLPEHLLLGLFRGGRGTAHALLSPVPTHVVQHLLDTEIARVGVQGPASIDMAFAASATLVLEHAADEADRLGHRLISPDHLLLGLLRAPDTFAATVLVDHGLSLEQARAAVAAQPDPAAIEPEQPFGTIVIRAD